MAVYVISTRIANKSRGSENKKQNKYKKKELIIDFFISIEYAVNSYYDRDTMK